MSRFRPSLRQARALRKANAPGGGAPNGPNALGASGGGRGAPGIPHGTHRSGGFSLTELLVALTIAAVLAAAAIPIWNRQAERTRRLDATDALLRIAVLQERFYFENGRYANAGELAAAPPAGLGVTGTERGYYALELRAPGGDPARGYQARAIAQRPGAQAGDETCRIFALDSTGQRSAENAEGDDSSRACWP